MHSAIRPHTLSVSQGMTTDFSGTSQTSHSWRYLYPAGHQTLPCASNLSLLSRNNQRATDAICQISLPVFYALYSHRLEPPAWSSITTSADTQTLCPPHPLLTGFFGFPFVPSFSRLTPQLSARGQRSMAVSQVPAGTAAMGFTRRRHLLQMWPFSAGPVTNVRKHH